MRLWRGLLRARRERRTGKKSLAGASAGEHLDWVRQVVKSLDLQDDQVDQLSTVIRVKLSDRLVRVAVAGEFSSGKSTLVNTLCRGAAAAQRGHGHHARGHQA